MIRLKLRGIEKELFTFWKTVAPAAAFAAGCKECAGRIWIPTPQNMQWAKAEFSRLNRRADARQKKWLSCLKQEVLEQEPHDAPEMITNVLFDHLVMHGVDQKRIRSLLEQGIVLVHENAVIASKRWPYPIKILAKLSVDGAIGILESLKQKLDAANKKLLRKLKAHLLRYGQLLNAPFLGKGDFEAVYPLLRKHSEHVGRKDGYPRLMQTLFDYPETPWEVLAKASGWLKQELPVINKAIHELAYRYHCEPTLEHVEEAINKAMPVKAAELLKATSKFRKILQPVAEQNWVRITPKYDVRLIQTPDYLVPFIPTGAMQIYDYLTEKPFCIFFITTSANGSPPASLPDVLQLIVHEEYGHCVNFLNSAVQYVKPLSFVERVPVMLSTPITEGISFHREFEAQQTFERILVHPETSSRAEQRLVKAVQQYCSFHEFVDAMRFVTYQWRIVRFVRAVSDVNINTHSLQFTQAVDAAHRSTGLAKKFIHNQVFSFQRNPGYAPSYSVFGQRLAELQSKAVLRGRAAKEFNTFVASMGFPARTMAEQDIAKKFRL